VAHLIKQLGDDAFMTREAASKELDGIGESALDALRKAARSSDDPEIRRRADKILRAITGRVAEKVAKELDGTWHLITLQANGVEVLGEDKAWTFTFRDGRFELQAAGKVYQAGTVQVTDPFVSPRAADLTVSAEGGGTAVAAIYAVEGDTLKYCSMAGGTGRHPKELRAKQGDGCEYSVWRRVKK
jgi:uncharacterized protein (TIGR03067 family)